MLFAFQTSAELLLKYDLIDLSFGQQVIYFLPLPNYVDSPPKKKLMEPLASQIS